MILVSKDQLLKKAMERVVLEFRKLLLKYFVAEDVTGLVDEKEIVRIDGELKEKGYFVGGGNLCGRWVQCPS